MDIYVMVMDPILFRRGLDKSEIRRRFRERLNKDGIIIAPGVFLPITAIMAAEEGFEAMYFGGAAFSNMLGLPDLGVFTLTEMATQVSYISSTVDIPLIVDADTGFGETINVARTVRTMEDAGAAAIHIEDQEFPKKCGHLSGKRVVSMDEMIKKIRAAVDARRDENFIIIARTDARDVNGLDDAIERANAYVEAGADMIFPESLHDEEEFRTVAQRVKAPLLANMTEFGKTPYITAKRFEELGYKVVIFPVTTFRYAMGAVRKALRTLKNEGTQKSLLGDMMSREEIYQLIGYWDYEKWDRDIAEKASKTYSRRINIH
ncbi:MAG: methylisocitrate lyase [Thermocladium sp.]